MEVPCIKEVRVMSTSALYSELVDNLVSDITDGIYEQANRGKRYYVHSFDIDTCKEDNEVIDIAIQKFIDEGYTVEEYRGVVKVKW